MAEEVTTRAAAPGATRRRRAAARRGAGVPGEGYRPTSASSSGHQLELAAPGGYGSRNGRVLGDEEPAHGGLLIEQLLRSRVVVEITWSV